MLKESILLIFLTFVAILIKKCYKYAIIKMKNDYKLTFSQVEERSMGDLEAIDIAVNAEIEDVADWFLLKENMSNKKVQKLCYYAQAWSLVLLDKDISKNANFEAWVHGPVNRTLYSTFKGFGWQKVKITNREETIKRIKLIFTPEQIDVLESVWDTYGEYGADQLEALTHSEKPWLEQRKGLGKFEGSNNLISRNTMKEFYQSLLAE